MDIFIGNIPEETTSYELRRFVNGLFEGRKTGLQFWKRKTPERLTFKVIDKHVEGHFYHYAIARIEPSDMGSEGIELLDQQFFRDCPLSVREYRSRSYMNERRAINWRERPWSGVERRCADRRQRILVEEVPTPSPAAS